MFVSPELGLKEPFSDVRRLQSEKNLSCGIVTLDGTGVIMAQLKPTLFFVFFNLQGFFQPFNYVPSSQPLQVSLPSVGLTVLGCPSLCHHVCEC